MRRLLTSNDWAIDTINEQNVSMPNDRQAIFEMEQRIGLAAAREGRDQRIHDQR